MDIKKYEIEILSKEPLWTFDENYNPVLFPNTYDTIEVIRCYPDIERTSGWYIDIPIENNITILSPYGTFFFKKKETCMLYCETIGSELGKQTLLENAFEDSKHNKNIEKFKYNEKYPVKNGLYIIKNFDDIRYTNGSFGNTCYLDENIDVKDFEYTDENSDYYLKKYIKMIDIEILHNLKEERIIFEIYVENETVYINHLFIHCFGDIAPARTNILLYTRILNYPIVESKFSAERLSYNMKQFGNMYATELVRSESILNAREHYERVKIAKRKMWIKILTECGTFLWKNKNTIISLFKKLK